MIIIGVIFAFSSVFEGTVENLPLLVIGCSLFFIGIPLAVISVLIKEKNAGVRAVIGFIMLLIGGGSVGITAFLHRGSTYFDRNNNEIWYGFFLEPIVIVGSISVIIGIVFLVAAIINGIKNGDFTRVGGGSSPDTPRCAFWGCNNKVYSDKYDQYCSRRCERMAKLL
jgi:hypothetical protein